MSLSRARLLRVRLMNVLSIMHFLFRWALLVMTVFRLTLKRIRLKFRLIMFVQLKVVIRLRRLLLRPTLPVRVIRFLSVRRRLVQILISLQLLNRLIGAFQNLLELLLTRVHLLVRRRSSLTARSSFTRRFKCYRYPLVKMPAAYQALLTSRFAHRGT